jgi:hypothetical protein
MGAPPPIHVDGIEFKLDFGHLEYEALSINTLSFDPVPGFFNIG